MDQRLAYVPALSRQTFFVNALRSNIRSYAQAFGREELLSIALLTQA